jgi:hypothetical protein
MNIAGPASIAWMRVYEYSIGIDGAGLHPDTAAFFDEGVMK